MHELTVTHEILEIVLKYARNNRVEQVHKIMLEIGELSDLEQAWIQRYFNAISRGSLAEGAVIEVVRTSCRFLCNACGNEFTLSLSADEPVFCFGCRSKDIRMVSGAEFKVKSMEAT